MHARRICSKCCDSRRVTDLTRVGRIARVRGAIDSLVAIGTPESSGYIETVRCHRCRVPGERAAARERSTPRERTRGTPQCAGIRNRSPCSVIAGVAAGADIAGGAAA